MLTGRNKSFKEGYQKTKRERERDAEAEDGEPIKRKMGVVALF